MKEAKKTKERSIQAKKAREIDSESSISSSAIEKINYRRQKRIAKIKPQKMKPDLSNKNKRKAGEQNTR